MGDPGIRSEPPLPFLRRRVSVLRGTSPPVGTRSPPPAPDDRVRGIGVKGSLSRTGPSDPDRSKRGVRLYNRGPLVFRIRAVPGPWVEGSEV